MICMAEDGKKKESSEKEVFEHEEKTRRVFLSSLHGSEQYRKMKLSFQGGICHVSGYEIPL